MALAFAQEREGPSPIPTASPAAAWELRFPGRCFFEQYGPKAGVLAAQSCPISLVAESKFNWSKSSVVQVRQNDECVQCVNNVVDHFEDCGR
jgi:hypothetical protein